MVCYAFMAVCRNTYLPILTFILVCHIFLCAINRELLYILLYRSKKPEYPDTKINSRKK